MLQRLAGLVAMVSKFHQNMQGMRKGALKWFGETEGRFLVAFGGMDALLVRMNLLLQRVASNSDNILVFRGNVEET